MNLILPRGMGMDSHGTRGFECELVCQLKMLKDGLERKLVEIVRVHLCKKILKQRGGEMRGALLNLFEQVRRVHHLGVY